MGGFKNDVVFAKNADLSSANNASPSESNGLATDGQLWIGSTSTNTGGTHVNVAALTSPNNTVTVGYASPNITLRVGGSIATTYNEDSGSATASANILQILGSSPVAGTSPVSTSGATNVVTVKVQKAAAIAASDATKVGLSNFNSAQFSVDANGFVSSIGNLTQVATQIFTATGTYTPTSGMKYCYVQVVGGGGGGGGVVASGANTVSLGGGGGAGGYSAGVFSAATIGASQVVTIGAAGSAGTTAGSAGGNGGTSSLGSLAVATGGTGGSGSAGSAVFQNVSGGPGGVGSSGTVNTTGQGGGVAIGANIAASFAISQSGFGGASVFGGGGVGLSTSSGGAAGNNSASYGAGGSGGLDVGGSTARLGGTGFAGLIFITEYI